MIINLIDRVKHTFSKDKALSSALQGILGFYPHNIEIYRIALAHKSQAYRNRSGKPLNNERLEFLGDAILEAVVSDIVFHRYERKREGFLTSTRSKIVQRSSLNKLSAELGLDRLVKATAQPGAQNNNIGGNAFEALIGAIYLDRGYRHCKWFVEKRIMGRLLDIDGVANKEVNFKSKLLEWTQKNRIDNRYQDSTVEGEGSNNPLFRSTVVIEGLTAGSGTGRSKKESQQMAAKDALTKLRREPKFLDSIFRAKEQRTAMEADEICALPKIDEIEEEIAHQKGRTSTSRHAKPSPNRPAADNNKPAAPARHQRPAQAEPANAQPQAAATPGPQKKAPAEDKKGAEKKNDATPRNRRPSARPPKAESNESQAQASSHLPAVVPVTSTAVVSATPPQEIAPDADRRSGQRPPRRSKQATPATAETPAGQEAEQPARRRQPRRRPKEQTEDSADAIALREDIVRQAEEAAYNDN